MKLKLKRITGLNPFRKNKSGVAKVKSVDSGKLGFLESIRGLAACAVMFAHILTTYYPGASGGPSVGPTNNGIIGRLFYGLPLGFMVSGQFAVILFFTLSGLVLTYKYFQSKNEKDLYRQAAKRYLRLAIPVFFIVMTAYIMISGGLMAHSIRVAEMTGSPDRVFAIIYSFPNAIYNALLGVFVNGNARYDPVLWTMSIELFGSFIIFGLAALFGNLKKRWIVYIGAIILLSHTYYACFVLGALLADLFHNTGFINFARDKVSKVYIYALLLLVWIIACFPRPTIDIKGMIYESMLISSVSSRYMYLLWEFLGAFLLLGIILTRPEIQKLLSKKFLVFIGGLSFSIYLTHYLVLHSIGDLVFLKSRQIFGHNLSSLLAALTTVFVTIAISVIWKKYIDDMSVTVSRHFANIVLR